MRTHFAVAIAAVSATWFAPPAPAQEAGAAGEGPTVLAPITVEGAEPEDPRGPVEGYLAERSTTGVRIDAPIEEQPLSLQVIPREVIEDTNATRLSDALGLAAGFASANSLGGLQDEFLLRGFEARVATDGAAESNVVEPTRRRDTANLERIEVLRGPASALYGQGQPGGVVNLVTKKPFDAFAVEAETFGSTLYEIRQELDVNVPFGGAWGAAGRLVAAVEGSNSFRFQDATDDRFAENRQFVAPSVAFRPTERTDVLIRGEYLRSSDIFDRGIPLTPGGSFATDIDDFFGDADVGNVVAEDLIGSAALTHRFTDDLSVRLFGSVDRNTIEGFSLEPELVAPFDIPPLGVVAGDTIFRQLEFRDFETINYTAQADLNYRLETGPVTQDFLFSVEYTRLDDERRVEQSGTFVNFDVVSASAPGTPTSLTPDDLTPVSEFRTDVESVGLVAFDKISLYDRVHLLGGGRVDFVDQSGGNLLASDELDEADVTEFSPRAGIVVEPLEDVPASVFFSYGESFQVNTELAIGGGVLDPQEGRVFEGGVRYGFNDDRLRLTVTAFDIEQENQPFTFDGTFFTTSSSESRGVEVTLEGAVTPELSIFASYTFTDAELTEVGAGLSDVAIGESPQGVPTHAAGLLAKYRFGEGRFAGLSLTGAVRFVGERVNFPSLVTPNPLGGPPVTIPAIMLDPYVRVDIGAAYEVSDRLRVGAGIQNLLNQEIATPSTINLAIPEAPITGFVRLDVRF